MTLGEFRKATANLGDDVVLLQYDDEWAEHMEVGIGAITTRHKCYHEKNNGLICWSDAPANGKWGWTRSEEFTTVELK